MNSDKRTALLMQALGQQGGTVHDLCKELGLDSTKFLYSDIDESGGINSDFSRGWFSVTTCDKEHLNTCFTTNNGNLSYFFGVISGQNFKNISTEIDNGGNNNDR